MSLQSLSHETGPGRAACARRDTPASEVHDSLPAALCDHQPSAMAKDTRTVEAQEGLLRHWSAEIDNYANQQSIAAEVLWRRHIDMRVDYASYIRDLVYLFREAAAEARRNKETAPKESTAYHEGRETAYIEVLLRMQSQSDAFMIPRENLGLDGFDPLKGFAGSSRSCPPFMSQRRFAYMHEFPPTACAETHGPKPPPSHRNP